MEFARNIERQHVLAFILLFLLAILLSIINAHHASIGLGTFFSPLFLASFVSIVIGAVATLLLESKIEERKLKHIAKLLPVDERKVVDVLTDKQRITQQDIVLLSGLSKLKVSRVLKRLEDRGVIKKEPYGRTNLITLKI